MLYHVTRNGEIYGPYTLEDLQRYVTSGNVLLTDMARGEGMTEWVPVSQILGAQTVDTQTPAPAQPIPAAQSFPTAPYAAPGYPGAPMEPYPAGVVPYPDAPNLPWWVVLLLAFFTCSLFMFVWNIVLSAWMKRVRPNSNALIYYIVATVLFLAQGATGSRFHVQYGQVWNYYHAHPILDLVGIATWVVRLIARFTMRADLEQHYNTAEPVGLSLSGVMTFFFGGLYFQYHINRINDLKRIARYRGANI